MEVMGVSEQLAREFRKTLSVELANCTVRLVSSSNQFGLFEVYEIRRSKEVVGVVLTLEEVAGYDSYCVVHLGAGWFRKNQLFYDVRSAILKCDSSLSTSGGGSEQDLSV